MNRPLVKLLGSLLFAGATLVLALYALLGMVAASAAADPLNQGRGPGTGPFGTTNQNNCSAYLASFGYQVDAVGHPKKPDGTPDPDSVVMLMPHQSSRFLPGRGTGADTQTQQQLSLGLAACALYYPGVPVIGIGLEQGESILMYSAEATDIQDAQAGRITVGEFWRRVGPTRRVLDARTGLPVPDRDFVNKNFAGNEDLEAIVPTNSGPPSTARVQIRVQASTAYAVAASPIDVVATVLNADGQASVGTKVDFAYTAAGGDPLVIASASTDQQGAARVRFTPPQGLQGVVLIDASAIAPTGTINASVPVTLGVPTGAAVASVITDALRLQGYSVVAPGAAVRYLPNNAATIAAEIKAPRFDLGVRAEILSMAGTLLSVNPTASSSEPVLLYRTQGNAFELLFHVQRSDWDAWVSGAINEVTLWNRITLAAVIDARTGQSVNARDFLHKNFAGAPAAGSFATARRVESNLVSEAGSDQLRLGRLRVPLDATAESFSVDVRTPGIEFAIYKTTDPTRPVYRSAGDTDGSKLKALTLDPGQFLLSIEGGGASSTISLVYVEHLSISLDSR